LTLFWKNQGISVTKIREILIARVTLGLYLIIKLVCLR